jgi:ATP-dependent Clp protease ATP-binding subunit ClpB
MLARGELHCIGATTLDEYRKNIEKDAALERRFQPVLVDAPSVEDTISILRGLKERFEVHHGVRIQDNALVAAATLSNRYISDRFLPDKAIDLVDEASAMIRTEIDSMPQELDEVSRRVLQLEIEEAALKKEKDKASKERLQQTAGGTGQSQGRDAFIEGKVGERASRHRRRAAAPRGAREGQDAGRGGRARLRLEPCRRAATRPHSLTGSSKVREPRRPSPAKPVAAGGGRLLREEVTDAEIAEIVSKWTGIPVTKLVEGEREKLLHLDEILHRRVVGQDEAVQAVADAVIRARSGIKDPRRPIGSFLFLGPTGVGKTELAKTLAQALFDSEDNLVRIDMSEYHGAHTVSRLVGAPPGYVGYEEGGQLTEASAASPTR